jgi:hypothetical protein
MGYREEIEESFRKFLLSEGEHPLVFRNWVIAERCDLPEGAIPLTPPPYFRVRKTRFEPYVKPLRRGLALGAVLPKGVERYELFYSFRGFPKDGEVLPGVHVLEGWLTWKKRIPPFEVQVYLMPDGTYLYRGTYKGLAAEKLWHEPLRDKTLKRELRRLLREEKVRRTYLELLRKDSLRLFLQEPWPRDRYLRRENRDKALVVLHWLEGLRRARRMEDHLLVQTLLGRREDGRI